MTSAQDVPGIVRVVVAQVGRVFGRGAIVFLPGADGLRPFGGPDTRASSDHDIAVATWAYEHSRPAGRGTDTLSEAGLRCVPMLTPRGPIGVLGIRSAAEARLLTTDQRQTLNSFANLAALAIERAQLAEKARDAELLQATEKLQRSLLDSVSHELRTPLVTITGALGVLEQDAGRLDAVTQQGLVTSAREEAERLNRLVANLLSMSRLEAGAMRLALQDADVEDLVGSALETLGPRSRQRPIETDIPPDLPMVPVDFVLIVQVLANLLDNAMKYSPVDLPIRILAREDGQEVCVSVSDQGPGIPTTDLDRVFDKFYRIDRQGAATGTGLGLSICRGIVEAHGGRIWAASGPHGGATVTFALPLRPR
jgi:two-component system sensor histidine kinase KdpD